MPRQPLPNPSTVILPGGDREITADNITPAWRNFFRHGRELAAIARERQAIREAKEREAAASKAA